MGYIRCQRCRRLPRNLKLCVATDITGAQESIITRSIGEWKALSPEFGKVPTIFLLYK